MHLCSFPKTEPLHGITCNEDLHKSKGKLQGSFFLASPNMFLASPSCKMILSLHRPQSLITHPKMYNSKCSLPAAVVTSFTQQHRSMKQFLASRVQEWTIISLLLSLLGFIELHSLQPLAEHKAFSRKVDHLAFPKGAKVASSTVSET